MKTYFVKSNDPVLTKIAKEISKEQINSSKTKQIVETMLMIAYGQQKDKKRPLMVGLAAPQIGILKRIILVDVKANGRGEVGDLRVYINPEITWVSKRKSEWYEGCFSTGKVCGIVKRPLSIKIRSFTFTFQPPRFQRNQPRRLQAIQAKEVKEKHTGYVARIFQHEIDHLNGKVFVDHIKDPNKLHWVLKKEFPIYRNKQAWRHWPKKCSFEKWNRIKGTSVFSQHDQI